MRTVTSALMPIAVAAAIVFGFTSAQAQVTGIANTPHNLQSGSVANADNNEICVYCHTPHASNTAIEAPLWNKPASGQTYTTYDTGMSSTIDGTVLAVGSVSIACLSCHDGTQAMDTVINAPGRDGLVTGGARLNPLAGSGLIGDIVGGNSVANLGIDLTNDHPIGIQYGGFTPAGAAAQIDADFVAPSTGTIGPDPIWWVETGANTTRDKTDMVLYGRVNGANTEPFVECASCHDPHTENTTFLRISNDSSGVCLACHVK